MSKSFGRFSLAFYIGLAMISCPAAAQAVKQPEASPEAMAIARVIRAKVPMTWLVEDTSSGTSAITHDQLAQADIVRRLAAFARKRKLDADPRYVRIREALEDAALAEIARLDLAKNSPVTQAERQARYVAHPGRYDQFRVRHILVALHGTREGADRTEQQAKATAESLEARLARGESFEALAQAYSDDTTTAAAGGELSTLLGAFMAPPFFASVRDAGEGTVTKPVHGPEGFHIIRVDQRIPATVSDAAYQIDKEIMEERLPTLVQAAVSSSTLNK